VNSLPHDNAASPSYREGLEIESIFGAFVQTLYEERFQSIGAVASALHWAGSKRRGTHHARALAATM